MDKKTENIIETLYACWEGELGPHSLALKKPSTQRLLKEFWHECANKKVNRRCFNVNRLKKLINPMYTFEYNKKSPLGRVGQVGTD